MSLGRLKEDSDKSKLIFNFEWKMKHFFFLLEGEVCKVVDAIVNPKVADNL